MTLFKTLDIRGLHFSNGFRLAVKEFGGIKTNGILEIILDRKRDFTEAFKDWAKSNGYNFSDVDDDNRMVRIFIKKSSRRVRAKA